MEQIKENKMGTAPILPLLLSMSIPAIFSMLVQACYNVVDSIFVSKISSDALSAISFAFPLQMIMVALGVGTGVGINSLVSRRLGEGRRHEAGTAATHGLILAICSSVVMLIVGLVFARPFFSAYTDNDAIISLGTTYIRIVTMFSFGVFVQIAIEKTLQATGNMIFPMLSQLLGAITNIILDPILIFGLLGAPKLGMAGAAIATVIGQILGMCFCIIILVTQSHEVHISFRGFHFQPRVVADIYRVGLPSIFMQAIVSVLVTFLNRILAGFSTAAVNVLGVYFKLQSFVFMPVFGLNQGVMPIMGYNFGAGNKKRLMETLKWGLIIAAGIMTVGTILFHIFPAQLLTMFEASTSDPALTAAEIATITEGNRQLVEVGIPAMRIISLSFIGAALGIMLSTFFQATGYGIKSLIISLVRQLVFVLPAAYLLSKVSLTAVWFAFPLAEIFAFILALLMYRSLYEKQIKFLVPVVRRDD